LSTESCGVERILQIKKIMYNTGGEKNGIYNFAFDLKEKSLLKSHTIG
jgi:hypothetical protein